MAILNLRNVPDSVHRRLRVQAARHARSMESEARAILQEACKPPATARPAAELQDWVETLYAGKQPRAVVKALIAERRREASGE